MADPITILLAIIMVVLLAIVALLVRVLMRRRPDETGPGLQLLQQQVAQTAQQQDQRLGQLNDQIGKAIQNLTANTSQWLTQNQNLTQQTQRSTAERLEAVGKTMGDLRGQLGQLGQATESILQIGSQVRKLQDILQNPKLRGGLGEWSLENLLAEVLPRQHYHMQYQFKNGNTVDALVELAQGRVAVDAKFPLPNFQAMLESTEEAQRHKARREFIRDVRKHIDAIAEKYIVPDEGTLDFALMYVPAENVYYELVVADHEADADVNAYGRQRHVIPVSPNLLYAYLQVIVTGLHGLRIEENAQRILQQLRQLRGDLELVEEDFGILGKHLGNAGSKYADTSKKLDRFGLRLRQMTAEDEI